MSVVDDMQGWDIIGSKAQFVTACPEATNDSPALVVHSSGRLQRTHRFAGAWDADQTC